MHLKERYRIGKKQKSWRSQIYIKLTWSNDDDSLTEMKKIRVDLWMGGCWSGPMSSWLTNKQWMTKVFTEIVFMVGIPTPTDSHWL